MFSYRHAFHAGNHADVLKHTVLIAVLRHLMQKEASIQYVDTHAGAGLYRLDGDYAEKSGEAAEGVLKVMQAKQALTSPIVLDYVEMVKCFNNTDKTRVYPGSPFIIHQMLRYDSRDRLKLYELHPTDHKALVGNVAQLEAGRAIQIKSEDGFEALKALLPPPLSSSGSRRACVLMDPSYELKSDYARVLDSMQDSLKRFATGTYLVWYPVIPRIEAHDLPRKLKLLCQPIKKPWLHATFAIGRASGGDDKGLSASGMFVVNPPHTLKGQLQAALLELEQILGRGPGQGFTVESGG